MSDQVPPKSFDEMVTDTENMIHRQYGAPVQTWAQSRGYDVENLPSNIVDLYNQFNAPAPGPAHVLTPQEVESHKLAQIVAPAQMQVASDKLNAQAVIDQKAEQHANELADDPMEGYTLVPKPAYAEGGSVSFDALPDDS